MPGLGEGKFQDNGSREAKRKYVISIWIFCLEDKYFRLGDSLPSPAQARFRSLRFVNIFILKT